MDQDLVLYLKSLDFSEEDIEFLTEKTPALITTPYECAMDNIMQVVSKGFPMEDIDMLIFANPNFLTISPEELSESLAKISGDIEEQLKNNPFLI